MTWSVAQPTWVAPSSRRRYSIWSTTPATPDRFMSSIAERGRARREVGAEQLVGRVDEVDAHDR